MKKIILSVIVVICLLFGVVACVGSNSTPIEPEVVTAQPSASEMIEPDTATEDPIPVEEPSIPEDTSTPTEEDMPVIEDVVLFDQDGVTIICKGLDMEEDELISFGPSLKLLITNDTDHNIVVTVDNVSINGFMIDPICAEDVAAGKKANGTITWFSSDLEDNDIEVIESIEFYFHIFDSDSYEVIVDASDIVSLEF